MSGKSGDRDGRLDVLFCPASVAVIGASRSEEKLGHAVLKNIIDSGFEGDVRSANPEGERMLCLILAAYFKPRRAILTHAEDWEVPLVLSRLSTVGTVNDVCGPIRLRERRQLEVACQAVESAFKYRTFHGSLDLA